MLRARAPSEGLHSVVGASASASKNGRQDKEPGAMGLVNAGAFRRNKGATDMRTNSSHDRRQTFVHRTSVGPKNVTSGPILPPPMSEDEAAQKFSALVIGFTQKDLANAAERTTQAAKHWKAGTRAPNSSSLITLGRRLQVVRDWVIAEMDVEVPADENAADTVNTVMIGLQMAANLPGQQGVMARMLLSKMQQEGGR